MTRARLKAIGLLVAVFVLGGVCGAGAMRSVDNHQLSQLMEQSPAEARRLFRLKAMARRLGLSSEQKQKIAAIVREFRDDCSPTEEEIWQERTECRQQAEEQALQVLTPEQRQRYQEITRRQRERSQRQEQRRERRRQRRRGRPGPGPGPEE
jgi:hypothetical protein